MEIQAFTKSRPTTNLIPDAKFALTKEQLTSGFMGVFTWKYNGNPRKTLIKIALGALMDATAISLLKPKKPGSQEERAARKAFLKSRRVYEEQRSNLHLAQYTRLRKVNVGDPHFLLSLPVLHFNSVASLSTILSVFGDGGSPDNDAVAKLQSYIDSKTTNKVDSIVALRRSHLPKATVEMFNECLQSVTFHSSDSLTVATLDFKISQIEAEALVSMPWVEIRPVDLYPLFSMWAEAEYESKHYGKSAISLSTIARTLPPHSVEDRRTDEHGLAVDMSGQPIFLPQECNNTNDYEAKFAAVGTKEDGDFALIDVNNQRPPVLPANIPILVDWVNFKFTYSNSAGRPVIMPLENARKLNASMAVNILNRPIPNKFIDRLTNYATACALSSYVTMPSPSSASPDDRLAISKVMRNDTRISAMDYMSRLIALDREVVYKYRDLVDGNTGALLPIRSFIMSLHPAMLANLEAMYAKYAVTTIVDALGILGTMVYYGVSMGETEAAANQKNRAAIEQGIDPKWTPPPAPLLTAKFSEEDSGLLPHQAKIRNLLRESPDFAILSVAAGGGKSMLAITDVLYEIKEKRSAPYLIMCPAHLVANYVSEIVEFTDGKVNVIPVTSYNIRTSGYARYESILENAPLNTVLIVDYAVLKFRARSAVYGTSSVAIYPVVEMIRKFRPGYCMLDESHFLKNARSATFKGVMNLIADIPKKRLASGTLNPDSPSDLPAQVAIMDPTIFGTREDFNEKYGAEVSGQRVTRWRTSGPNSIHSAMADLKKNVVWCPAQRKEWACALPPRQDRFISVDLTENQRAVYDAIFDDMIQQIRKAAQTDKSARRLLDTLEGKKGSKQDEDDFDDLTDSEDSTEDDSGDGDIGPGLQPYLVDIERFVTNPGFHPYAKNGYVSSTGQPVAPLSGDDLLPPKLVALKKLMLEDYRVLDKSHGKVLIFVNYTESAQAVFDAMPPELQQCGILYSTANKTELVNKFKTDPKIRWMVGIRKSLEVGLNLQVASVLVRLEGVWTPGEQEQGDSRIARPYFGPGGDKRAVLKFDTLVCDRCVVGSTLIPTEHGLIPIEELEPGVGGRRQELGVIVASRYGETKVRSWWNQGMAYTRKIQTTRGYFIEGTHNHRLLSLVDGEIVWRELRDLNPGDIVVTGHRKLTRKTPLTLNLQAPPGDACFREDYYAEFNEFLASNELVDSSQWRDPLFAGARLARLCRDGLIEKVGRLPKATPGSGGGPIQYRVLPESVVENRRKLTPVTKLPKFMTPELAYCLGLYTAEGLGSGSGIRLGMLASGPVSFFHQTICDAFGVSGTLGCKLNIAPGWASYEKHGYRSSFSSNQLIHVFNQLGMKLEDTMTSTGLQNSHFKEIPWSILQADEQSQLAFLAGHWDGDGTHSAGELGFCTVSRTLKHHLMVLLTAHGFSPRVGTDSVFLNMKDSVELWARIAPFTKGQKQFEAYPLQNQQLQRSFTEGIPFDYWGELVYARARGEYSDGTNHYIYEDDDGNEVVVDRRHHLYELQSGNYKKGRTTHLKVFLYKSYKEGRYDELLKALKVISASAYAKLMVLIGAQHRFDTVELTQNSKEKKQTYDLSISDGEDGKEPAYVAGGLISHNTLDITKAARLRAKVVAVAKFENFSNPAYDTLEDIPVVPMTLESIQTMNDFSTNLAQYEETLRQLNQIVKDENEEYKAKMMAEGGFHFTQVATTAPPDGCALLSSVPYAQGTELYKASELGLARVDNYLGMELSTEDESEDDSSDAEDENSGDTAVKAQRSQLLGLPCHTEYGEGTIVGAAAKNGIITRIHVRLNDGTTARGLRATNVFVITRTETNAVDMRNKLAQAAGLSVTAPITVPGLNVKQTKITMKEQREAERQREREIKERQRKEREDSKKKSKMAVALQLNIVNGYLQVGYVPGKNEATARAMEALGFKQNPSYYYTRVRTFKHLIDQAQKWADADFTVADNYDSGALAALSVALTQNGLQSHRHYANLMGAAQFKNYMRNNFRPSADKKRLNLFAIVTDGGWSDPLNVKRAEKRAEAGEVPKPAYGIAYLCLPAGGGHPASKAAIMPKYKVPATRWMLSTPMLTRFVGSVLGVHKVIAEMHAAGIKVANVDELNKYARSIKKVAPKVDDTVWNTDNVEDVEERPARKTRNVEEKPVKEPARRGRPPAEKAPKVTTPVGKKKRPSKDDDDWSLV